METKLINLSEKTNGRSMNYPVGVTIQYNKPIINAIANAIKEQLPKKYKRVVLCCRGSSGALMASIAAFKIPRSVIFHFKKEGESSHSTNGYSFLKDDYIVIIDDFMCTGNTLIEICKELKDCRVSKVDCIALGGRYISNLLIYTPETVIHIKD
jgi:orotate phosphoribosyltransferase